MSGFAQAKNTRGGRKLAHINEDGLTKRQQRKKEIAEEAAAEAAPEEMITLDEIDVTIVEEGSYKEVTVALEEDAAAGDVEEEISVTVDVPAPPASSDDHDPKGPHHKENVAPEPLEDEPEHEEKEEKKHHGKGKGKDKKTKDLVHGEGKPGKSLSEGHKKKKKGAKK